MQPLERCSVLASMLGYFLFFCQHLIFRVKDYISSGLHMKVTNPDGAIHSTGKTIRRYW